MLTSADKGGRGVKGNAEIGWKRRPQIKKKKEKKEKKSYKKNRNTTFSYKKCINKTQHSTKNTSTFVLTN